ncbi:MAG: heme o synthase [Acidobacteriota bacterium]
MNTLKQYLALTKPRITFFILMSTGVGFLFGSRVAQSYSHAWSWAELVHTLIGTMLIAGGTAALNQWYEREGDGLMLRTKGRPIPSGQLSATQALLFGTLLSAVGFIELVLGANVLTGLLALFTLASYLFIYTPLKRVSPISTTIGAIPGAMPPLIGYAAASGHLNYEAGLLFAILFVWQFPHFYAIAWMYREDYARAGIRMLPVVEPNLDSTARRILWFSVALVPLSLAPAVFAMAGTVYLIGAILLCCYVLYAGYQASVLRTRVEARKVLFASIVYLPVLYGLLAFGR